MAVVAIIGAAAAIACGTPAGTASPATATRVASQRRLVTPAPVRRGTAPLAAVDGSAGCGTPREAGEAVESLESGGVTRTYRVYVPAGYHPAVPLPLVLNFHGSSRTGASGTL